MPKFTVQYCANWDGGSQERDAAKEAILKACPSASVATEKLNEYPVQVKILNESKAVIFGPIAQRNLFRKNASMRSQTMKDIEAAIKAVL